MGWRVFFGFFKKLVLQFFISLHQVIDDGVLPFAAFFEFLVSALQFLILIVILYSCFNIWQVFVYIVTKRHDVLTSVVIHFKKARRFHLEQVVNIMEAERLMQATINVYSALSAI